MARSVLDTIQSSNQLRYYRRPEVGGTASVDAILQNLSRRPNVRSTLILSRKDGSIIKVSGAIADDMNEGIATRYSSMGSGTNLSQDSGNDDSLARSEGAEKTIPPTLSRAQLLAGSIYGFVASATDVAASLRTVAEEDASLRARESKTRETATKDKTQAQAEEDMQLLRLRLRREEVIIFPDPNYLCCVVQDLEKTTR